MWRCIACSSSLKSRVSVSFWKLASPCGCGVSNCFVLYYRYRISPGHLIHPHFFSQSASTAEPSSTRSIFLACVYRWQTVPVFFQFINIFFRFFQFLFCFNQFLLHPLLLHAFLSLAVNFSWIMFSISPRPFKPLSCLCCFYIKTILVVTGVTGLSYKWRWDFLCIIIHVILIVIKIFQGLQF